LKLIIFLFFVPKRASTEKSFSKFFSVPFLLCFFVLVEKRLFFGYWVRGFYKAGGEVSFFLLFDIPCGNFELLMQTGKKKKWKKMEKKEGFHRGCLIFVSLCFFFPSSFPRGV